MDAYIYAKPINTRNYQEVLIYIIKQVTIGHKSQSETCINASIGSKGCYKAIIRFLWVKVAIGHETFTINLITGNLHRQSNMSKKDNMYNAVFVFKLPAIDTVLY